MTDERELLRQLEMAPRVRSRAAAKLYDLNARRYLAFLRRRGHSLADAEEIVQDVFRKILTTSVAWSEVQNASAYLWRMVRSAEADFLRKRGDVESVSIDENNGDQNALDGILAATSGQALSPQERHDLTDCIARTFSALREDHAERADALTLVAVEGWSHKELAEYLDRSYGATRQFFSQCCKKFREYFEQICPEYVPAEATQ